MQTLDIHNEVAAFLASQAELNTTTESPWVVFANATFQSRFDSFEAAYQFAVSKFDSGKYLIRNICAPEPFIPLMFVAK